jgi:hypothetical protein
MSRKQQLLKRHRRNKRVGLLIGILLLVVVGIWVAWWLPFVLGVLAWVAHEAWFADHLFYAPNEDYQYRFSADAELAGARLEGGRLLVDQPPGAEATLVLAIEVKSGWLGRFLDPRVEISGAGSLDSQTFERGVKGVRYLNLSGLAPALAAGELRLRGRFCTLQGAPRLWAWATPDYTAQRVMVVAPHADDAELAAFGLYSQAEEPWIVTLTAGEIEAEHYQQMGLDPVEASRIKGRVPGTALPCHCGPGCRRHSAYSWVISACNCRRCAQHRISLWPHARQT